MKIYIAKHYWKNGENATWECHEKIDKELFEYIKRNYHKFVLNKPNLVEQNGYYLYICYEDSKDVYNRRITNATFFISTKLVPQNLCSLKYQGLELNVKNKDIKLKLFGISLVFGLGLLLIIKNNQSLSDKSTYPEENLSVIENSSINEINISDIGKKIKSISYRQKASSEIKYKEFANVWNNQIRRNKDTFKDYYAQKRFMLSSSDDNKTIKRLNKFLKSFYNIDENIINENVNDNLKQKYADFFDKNHYDKNITLNDNMTIGDIKKYLREITRKKKISKVIETILMMNNIYIFEKIQSESKSGLKHK